MTDAAPDPAPDPDPDGWEQPPRRPAAFGAAPVLSVDGFQGPLDWLLDLARARRIDLSQLSIAALVDAFADALAAALASAGPAGPSSAPTLARWSDWLVMAAELALLRSRLLLPPQDAGAAPEAEDWRDRLLARAAAAAATDWLERRGQLGRDVFNRGRADTDAAPGTARTADVTALLRACLVALRLPPGTEERYRVPGPPLWSQADAASRIRDLLPTLDRAGVQLSLFLPPFPDAGPGVAAEPDRWRRAAVAGTFGAALELARQGAVRMEQDAALAAIRITRG